MEEQRKHAILRAATILPARKRNEIGSKPFAARECAIARRPDSEEDRRTLGCSEQRQ
jgi:hypothetical protein